MRVETDIPARLDRLPWSAWHWRVVFALGITWILDGLEVTVVGAVGSVLQRADTLALTSGQVGLAASAYLAGAILGSLIFGWLTDKLGRKKLFLVTLLVYLVAVTCTAFSWGFASFCFFRFLTGMGIGGEYSAINSAIDELLPARVRGLADLAINGTFWVGAALGAVVSLILLDERVLSPTIGWRLIFGLGATLGAAVMLVRRYVPESPRWLVFHGQIEEAERVVTQIEADVTKSLKGKPLDEPKGKSIIEAGEGIGFGEMLRILLKKYPMRTVYGLVLMIAQAFFYNAIFFTYALVLTTFFGVDDTSVGKYIFPFAVGNFAGPLLLGRLFDTVGRRRMIGITYAISGVMLAITGWMFVQGMLTATVMTMAWSVIFFVASAAASSAYLTVSEIFPVEMRGMAIAIFYSVGTGVGGVFAPALLGALIQTKSRPEVANGYYLGAGLMVAAALVALLFGIDAEGKSLEELADSK